MLLNAAACAAYGAYFSRAGFMANFSPTNLTNAAAVAAAAASTAENFKSNSKQLLLGSSTTNAAASVDSSSETSDIDDGNGNDLDDTFGNFQFRLRKIRSKMTLF